MSKNINANILCVCANQVIEYLGGYTHKIAMSNHRLINVTDQAVTFHYRDYRDAAKKNVG